MDQAYHRSISWFSLRLVVCGQQPLLLPFPACRRGPAILRFMLKGDDQALQNNKMFVILFALSAIWLILILNYIGLRFGKWVENIGGLSIWLPCSLLILFESCNFSGTVRKPRSPSRTSFQLQGDGFWSAWSNICFAFTGIELASTMSARSRIRKETCHAPSTSPVSHHLHLWSRDRCDHDLSGSRQK